jgi:DNA-binding GntR family transcriptional regulator
MLIMMDNSDIKNIDSLPVETPGEGKEPYSTHAERVYQTVKSDIIYGRIEPGVRLVRQTIAKRLHVSSIPVIEALVRLENDGLIESVPHVGARVKLVNEQTILHGLILREAFECQVSRLCAINATSEQFGQLYYKAGRLDEMMREGEQSTIEEMDAHKEFHLMIAEFSGYPFLVKELERAWMFRMMIFSSLSAKILAVPPGWHHNMVTILNSRDPEKAEICAREHVHFGRDRILEVVKEMQASLAAVSKKVVSDDQKGN